MPPMGNPDDTVRPETLPPERPPEASSWELRPLLRLLLAADPVAPSVARQQVRRWLAALAARVSSRSGRGWLSFASVVRTATTRARALSAMVNRYAKRYRVRVSAHVA